MLSVGTVWLMVAAYTILEFVVGYGNPSDTYTGQDYDRSTAWVSLIALLALTAMIVASIILIKVISHRRMTTGRHVR
jgi:hypothetical protein